MNESQVRDLLHVADEVPVSSPPSAESLRASSSPPARRRGWIVLTSAASAALVLGGFVAIQSAVHNKPVSPAADADAQPADPNATMRPDLMKAQPTDAFPGEYVQLRFPKGTSRGLGFVLEAKVADTWDFRSGLYSVPNGNRGEPSSPRPGESFAIQDIAIGGEGPDLIAIPPETPPGTYRICTANGGKNFCTPVTVGETTGLRAQSIGPDLQCPQSTSIGSDWPVTSEAPTAFLVCAGDASAPRLITADDRSFDVVLGALSLPDKVDVSDIALCVETGPIADVVEITSSGYQALTLPANGCQGPRWEVTDALDADVPWSHRQAPLDPLTLSLTFAGSDDFGPLQVKSGSSLRSRLDVMNATKQPVAQSDCSLSAPLWGLVPLDQVDAELPFGATVDCGGDLVMKPGFQDSWTGPEFRATTPQGDPLPPGQYLAVVDINGRSDRIVYPVTVTP